MKCKELMYGDWIASETGFPMQITNVGDDYAYATFEGLEGDPWEFDDKDYQPAPIEITNELLVANRWELRSFRKLNIEDYFSKNEGNTHLEFTNGKLAIWFNYEKNDGIYADIVFPCKYVHQLQQALRLAGMIDLANNFKV